MKKNSSSRRSFVRNTVTGISMLPLSSLLYGQQNAGEKKKIVVVGGHPDDPECGCGGTIALLAKQGHAVTLFYLTNGDEGIEDKTMSKRLLSVVANASLPVRYLAQNHFLATR